MLKVVEPTDDCKRVVRLHQAIAQKIGSSILAGELQPGAPLDGEIENSEAHGVSRTAYREAIRILVAKGLLESRPKAGTRVTPRTQWNLLDPDILSWIFSAEKPDEQFVRDLFELRRLIEPAAAAFAAARRTESQVSEMRDALTVMRAKGLTTAEGRKGDQRFHAAILDAANNKPLASLAGSVSAAVNWTTRFKQRKLERPRDPIIEHLAVLEAIETSDPERARAAMEQLLELALDDMDLTNLSAGK